MMITLGKTQRKRNEVEIGDFNINNREDHNYNSNQAYSFSEPLVQGLV